MDIAKADEGGLDMAVPGVQHGAVGEGKRYFRREWDDVRSGDHAAWGSATYWFETDAALSVLRQVEVYDGGQRLCYDEAHPEDEHGFLCFGPAFPADEWPELFEVTARQFEREWQPGRTV